MHVSFSPSLFVYFYYYYYPGVFNEHLLDPILKAFRDKYLKANFEDFCLKLGLLENLVLLDYVKADMM